MSVIAKNLVPDGFQAITKGVNSGEAPNLLPRDQLAWLINGSTRRGFPYSRPGWQKRTLSGDEIVTGNYQGAICSTRTGEIIFSRAGRIYAIRLNNMEVRELTTASDRNPSNRLRAWFCEAEDFILIQDGQSACGIYDGATFRRSDPSVSEVPTGTCMAYASGRLWVTLPDQRSYVGSDIVYGDSGTAAYARRDAILKFTENNLYSQGGAFAVPYSAGDITAMVPVAQLDTSLGQGPLQVFTTNGAFSVNAPFNRELWAVVNFPVQSASLLGSGALSDWSAVNVNGDIWYRANDGVRSFQVARRDFGTWVNTALSTEVERALDRDTRTLLGFASAALFDNRLLMTTNPMTSFNQGTIHRGLVVLDFHPTSSIEDRVSGPIWDGLWTGLDIFQIISGIFNGIERCFILARNSDDGLELWELTLSYPYDNDGTEDLLIQWQIEGASYNWPDAGWGLKRLEHGDVWYDQLKTEVNFTLQWRPDQEPNWQTWHSWASCANTQTCPEEDQNPLECITLETLGDQYRVRMRFPVPADDCDSITKKPYREGFEFQPRLIIEGPCRVKKFRLFASNRPEEVMGGCTEDSTCQTLEACAPDDEVYSIADATLGAANAPRCIMDPIRRSPTALPALVKSPS